MKQFRYLWISVSVWLIASCAPDLPDDVKAAYDALPAQLDYNIHVKPVLSDKCFACHGPDKATQQAGLRLDMPDAAYAALTKSPGKVAIAPGDIGGSEVVHRILSNDPAYMMPEPTSHLSLSAREKAILIKWIDQGATYKPHWSFVGIHKANVPTVGDKAHAVNPIDHFVLRKLNDNGLKPSGEADKEILLRRLSLDLTGLPPTLAEIEDFLKDSSADAYEKQVDRLLKSPHYGEKMAVGWLDLARFADSHGYTVDRVRDMSPYRDWVIKAFNDNLPYDKFIHWQLAGDLMPDPTKDMIIATAFNRNHPQNMEGGIIEKEFQTEYVIDRTNTVGDALLGLSLGCARCHDHKFDPISQKNYFELYSFFNNVKEAGQISWDDALPTPTLMLPTPEEEESIRLLEQVIAEQEKKIEEEKRAGAPKFQTWLTSGSYKYLAREVVPRTGLLARYDFDDGTLRSRVNPGQKGVMKQNSGLEKPVFEKRDVGKALALNGDVWLDLKEVGVFRRSDPFSIGIRVYIPKELSEGVIFHKSIAERLYNFRGYHLYLKDNKLELSIAHTAPSNAITKISAQPVPRDQWIHLTVTYDGSSKAQGLDLYVDGMAMPMTTVTDQLTKGILYEARVKVQPGLQIGAWDRGYGLKFGKADDIVVYDRTLTPFEVKVLAGKSTWSDVARQESRVLSPEAKRILEDYYFSAVHPGVRQMRNTLNESRTRLADVVEPVREIMVMQESVERKKAFILERGEYDAPGEEVFPNTPESILPFPDNLPKNRYGLAQWITHPDNPLTARVAVNRIWQNFFGTGLVKTSEDFGAQGELPSHPELLDWLAAEFMESGWDIKKLNKRIAMSATYRQDSRATPEAREKDPGNRLLSHGPAVRLSAEMLRDNALAASGLLNKMIGGKSVKPYQPDGLWAINNSRYEADSGDAVYRRSLYVLVKRSVPNPTLATFDAPSRSYCVARRQATNTPLQALVTLNDPTFVEAARVMGETMTAESDIATGVRDTFKKLTGRSPSDDETDLLLSLRERQLQRFLQAPEKIKGWLHTGQHRISANVDSIEVAANAVVASTILNADATITKR